MRDEGEVVKALFDKVGNLFDDRFETSGVEFTLEAGDGTEGALLVAPFGDLDIGMVARACDDPAAVLCRQIDFRREAALFLCDEFIDLFVVSHTGEDVYLGEFFHQLLFVAFAQASAHDENGVLFPFIVQVEEGIDALLFGGIDKSAGVDDDHIGFCIVIGHFIGFEPSEHHFGVDKILGAAEADEVEFFWHGYSLFDYFQ